MDPPETARRPVTDRRHGETVVDPYRWLEADDEAVREWTDRQTAYADAVLDCPERDRLHDRFADAARTTEYGPLRPSGGRFFARVRDPDGDQPRLVARETADGEARTVVDPDAWGGEPPRSLDWFVPGRDGERVAYGVAPGGTEQYDVVVVDADGDELDRVPDTGRGGARGFAWTDGGFYYTYTGSPDAGDADGQLDKEVRFHELGTDPADDRVVLADVDERTWPVLSTDGDALVVTLASGWDAADVYALRADPTADPLDLRPVVVGADADFSATLADGRLYLRTDHGASRGRALAADLATLLSGDAPATDADGEPTGLDAFAEVVPEREAVLRDLAAAGDRLVAHYHRDAVSELRVLDRDGDAVADVDLPAFSTVDAVHGDDDGERAYCTLESFDRPTRTCEVSLSDGARRVLQAPDAGFDVDVTVTREWFESADGTDVPAFVVRRAGVDADGEGPAVLTGYGGFRVNRTPRFDRYLEPFLAAGGTFALATLRGGAEYGEEWHEAGRRDRKENVFDDFLAVADGLVDRGFAAPDRLGIVGGSNGGLLVGAALVRRPERFGAVVCKVPLLDMLRFHEFLLGESWTTEYGHPDDPEAFDYLRAYSPYHNVAEAAYPPTLLTTAAGDTRVHPCHARKMAARLQHRTTGDAPVALRVREDTGHGVGKPRSVEVAERAEEWGFLCRFLGVDV